MNMSFGKMLKLLYEFIRGNPNRKPKRPLPVVPLSKDKLFAKTATGEEQASVTWFGHSAVLLRIDGMTLFLDPMLGRAPSPFPIFGNARYSRKLPIEIEELPELDAVIFSHDHYDHLDYGTIRKLRGKVKRFFVPLGVAAHLERWGIDPAKISEHDWWEEIEYEGLKLATAPARHFSGRNVVGRNGTLWCSWIIQGKNENVFFSGDSGYGPHFKEIGERYGPFDLTLIECGQYDERWAAIHMMPEETVQANADVRGKAMVPIHWGAFTLAMHDWFDPPKRASEAARERGVTITVPRIGETVAFPAADYPASDWWK
ncbi:MBL fold metallo-hydrolase [Cohnella suwonensis]|uniref:MBL fold metallo-hydrolase n=1 Tax=Cohnella suwonensis TaxID=696072 RepID=A0ABW0LYZ6_9BACL